PERLHAGEEVVAARAREDEHDVRADAQDVARRREQAQAARILREDEVLVRVDSLLTCELLRGGPLAALVHRLPFRLRSFGAERRAAAASRLRQARDEPGERERWQGEDDERRAPRERGDVARDGEADPGAEQLAREDVAVDA